MRIVQISDCHVVEPGQVMADRVDSAGNLAATIERVHRLGRQPDIVLLTGDLTNDGRPGEYDHLAELLEPLSMPIVAVPGNHDDRTQLRNRFDLPGGAADDPIDHVVELDDRVRLVCLDTTVPGDHGGSLCEAQLAWLDEVLTEADDRVTVVAQHHPPFHSTIPWMDSFALANIGDQRRVLARHPQVIAILAGHFHRPITVGIGSAVAWCAPSSAAQIDLDAQHVTYTDEPPAFLVHDLTDVEHRDGPVVRTHLVVAGEIDRWRPDWAVEAGR